MSDDSFDIDDLEDDFADLMELEDDEGDFQSSLASDLNAKDALGYFLNVQVEDDIFSDFTWEDMEKMAKTFAILQFEPGERIIVKGEFATFVAIILDGVFEAVISPTFSVPLNVGKLVGEMSYFEGGHRSAHIDNKEKGVLAVLTYEDLDKLASSQPELAQKLIKLFAVASVRKLRKMVKPMPSSGEKKDGEGKEDAGKTKAPPDKGGESLVKNRLKSPVEGSASPSNKSGGGGPSGPEAALKKLRKRLKIYQKREVAFQKQLKESKDALAEAEEKAANQDNSEELKRLQDTFDESARVMQEQHEATVEQRDAQMSEVRGQLAEAERCAEDLRATLEQAEQARRSTEQELADSRETVGRLQRQLAGLEEQHQAEARRQLRAQLEKLQEYEQRQSSSEALMGDLRGKLQESEEERARLHSLLREYEQYYYKVLQYKRWQGVNKGELDAWLQRYQHAREVEGDGSDQEGSSPGQRHESSPHSPTFDQKSASSLRDVEAREQQQADSRSRRPARVSRHAELPHEVFKRSGRGGRPATARILDGDYSILPSPQPTRRGRRRPPSSGNTPGTADPYAFTGNQNNAFFRDHGHTGSSARRRVAGRQSPGGGLSPRQSGRSPPPPAKSNAGFWGGLPPGSVAPVPPSAQWTRIPLHSSIFRSGRSPQPNRPQSGARRRRF